MTLRPFRRHSSVKSLNRRSIRPIIELLEDRTVPALVSWTGAGNSFDWDTPSNWSTGVIPGSADDVVISQTGITITHTSGNYDSVNSLTSAASLSLSSGALSIGQDSSIGGSFTISSATLSSSGNLTVSGLFTLSGAALHSVGGPHTLTANGGLILSGSNPCTLDGWTLVNVGAATSTEGAVVMENGATIDNLAGATFNDQIGTFFNLNTGDTSVMAFNNAGLFITSANQSNSTYFGYTNVSSVNFNNTGVVQVNSGGFAANGGGVSSGSFTVAAGCRLGFYSGGPLNTDLTSGSSVQGAGTVSFGAGATIAGSFNVSGGTQVSGVATFTGTVNDFGPLTILNSSNLDLSQATLGPAVTNLPSLNLGIGGSLEASQDLSVSGLFTWSGGALHSVGGQHTFTANGGMALSSSNPCTLDGWTLVNVGAATSTVGAVVMENGATIDNLTGATFNDQIGTFFNLNTGDTSVMAFNNAGLFVTSVNQSNSTYFGYTNVSSVNFNNTGVVQVNSGGFAANGGGVSSGSFTVAAGCRLGFYSGGPLNTDLTSGSSVQGAGSVTFGAGETIGGSINVSSVTVSNGSFNELIGGYTPGTQFGQLTVANTASLTGYLNLQLTNGFVPQLGDQFKLINNQGSNPINGTFTNVLQGSLIWAGDVGFTISYVGGDGNDVVLTVSHVQTSSLSGFVWEDFNNDGLIDFGENGISGVTVRLQGTDNQSHAVNLTTTTDASGSYEFSNLNPGNYTIIETQPAGYNPGINSVGTINGVVTGSISGTDQFFVNLPSSADGINYNFGEQPVNGGTVHSGQTAGIGFWNNTHGQALIKSLNGGQNATELGNWLAATFVNIFGANAGSNDLAGMTNTQVANAFQQKFMLHGPKLDAQVMATALSVYVTNNVLAGNVATAYGFTVSHDGAGVATINIGSDGAAVGQANNTTMNLMDILLAADSLSAGDNGILYGGNTTQRNAAMDLFSRINQSGGI
jgi:hypothetical protein